MKILAGFYLLALAANLCASPIIDDSDPYPYQDLTPEALSGTKTALSLQLKVRTKGVQSYVEAQITLYNNTNQNYRWWKAASSWTFNLRSGIRQMSWFLPMVCSRKLLQLATNPSMQARFFSPAKDGVIFSISPNFMILSGARHTSFLFQGGCEVRLEQH
jgi:hypothetical protein